MVGLVRLGWGGWFDLEVGKGVRMGSAAGVKVGDFG